LDRPPQAKKAPPPRDKGQPPSKFTDAMRGRGSSMDDVTGDAGDASGDAGGSRSAAASEEY